MFSEDFYYDGQYLSDYNCIICNFEASTGSQIVSAGSHITFNKVALNNGKNYALVGHQYDTCIETSFYICKNPEIFSVDDRTITSEELRDLMVGNFASLIFSTMTVQKLFITMQVSMLKK